jgi:prepilin signal peptidase PulO-like enzyme (type II secretory pathway)
MNIIILISSFLLGSIFGSFFYTLALRYSNGDFRENLFNALTSPSKCPNCGTRISPVYLTPIIGFLLARASCRKCGVSISPIYPAAEIFYGTLASSLVTQNGLTSNTAVFFILAGISVAISIIDLKTMTIPDPLVIFFALISLYPFIISYLEGSWMSHIWGLLVMACFFIIIIFIFPGSFGGGDIKFASAMGFSLGLEQAIIALETALIAGTISGIIYAAAAKKSIKSKIPFAPFLSAGLIVSYLFGRDIALIYYRIIM